MFKRLNRLTKNKEIERVFKKGQSHYGKLLGIKAVNNDLDYNRYTVIVNAKVSKKAVARNRLQRQIRHQIKQLTLKTGYDVIIICLPQSLGQSKEELANDLQQSFSQLGLN